MIHLIDTVNTHILLHKVNLTPAKTNTFLPAHGCFARDREDTKIREKYGIQVLILV